ncbi:universal stress protein [Aureibacter tunicatorum]|uniref:Nucleotide-binding universal stress UspA family protein n=1 Tax=Aureibacter tunicatorum TaxID=866807 RepID=A0AAE4BP64_9BACT|nr:universal stress protein [Aureibacter tunicatorum]MDR6237624.1 nucleotide-binding universal stress UspA family protein [Aureibacter tunicatorum]BDD02659.1 hypothetical protein AUTU_01420 [Aureibacter tunicatorum]
MYKKIAVAVAFSPTCQALISEALRLQSLFDSELLLIHVGKNDDEEQKKMDDILRKASLAKDKTKLIWKSGNNTADIILEVCLKEKVDLLVAGALRKENLYGYYIGSIARKILRKSNCSVLMLTNPSLKPNSFNKVVIQAGASSVPQRALSIGCQLAKMEESSIVHIVREVKLLGLSMALASEETEDEYGKTKKNIVNEEVIEVERKLKGLDTEGLRLNIKVTAGKPGHELSNFVQKIHADLLIMQGLDRKMKFIDRIFRQDLEHIMSNLPTNLLIVH